MITSYCSYVRPAQSCPLRLLGLPILIRSGKCTTQMVNRQISYDSVVVRLDTGVLDGWASDGDQ